MTEIPRRVALRTAGLAAASLAAAAACSTGEQKNSTNQGASATTTSEAPATPGGPAAQVTQPAAGVLMTPGYARTIAQFAYVWGWPMVNMINRYDTITKAPNPGLLGGILPVAPQGRLAMLSDYILPSETFVTCPNQDVVYGLAYMSLDEQPVIVQVPDFGDRFWVYALSDARTDQFGQLGKPYGTKPGFYLLAGPNWKGDKPNGVHDVLRSSTALAIGLPRIFMDSTPEDHNAVQSVINQVNIYPLAEFDGKMKIVEWAELPTIPAPPADASAGETKWVVPEKFFDQLGQVLDTVPPLPGEEAMYAQFRALLDTAKQDPAIHQVLVDTAVATEKDVIADFFAWKHNGRPAGNGWNRSTNNAQWGIDYFDRTGTAKSNMFDNRPAETQYFYTDNDSTGAPLEGGRNYKVTFPVGQEPPVNGFWSLTLYNDKHLFSPNRLNRYSIGTKSKILTRGPDGSLTVYAGPKSPGPDKESNWLPAPDGHFSLFIRAYWGKQPILDGSWQPPTVDVA